MSLRKEERTIEREGKTFIALCHSSDVHSRHGISIEVDDYTDIALFRIEGQCHAVSNVCPHQHQPVIAQGVVEGCMVTCPMHGWEYDLRTGEQREGAARLRTFGVIEEGGIVYVEKKEPQIPKWMMADI